MKMILPMIITLSFLQSTTAYGMEDKTSPAALENNKLSIWEMCDGAQMFALFLCYCVQDFSSYALESLNPQPSPWRPVHSPSSPPAYLPRMQSGKQLYQSKVFLKNKDY